MNKNKLLASVIFGGVFSSLNTYALDLPDKIDGKFYGQLNQVALYADDGERSDQFIADSDNSGSRLGVRGDVDAGDGLSVGFKLEAAWQRNPSSKINMDTRSIAADWKERYVDFSLSGNFGSVSAGLGDGAANGINESDLSGTLLALLTAPVGVGAGFKFQDDGVYGPSVSQTLNHQDFESRYDRIRYDSPSLAGSTVISLSSGVKSNNDVYEASLRSKHDIGGNGKIEFGLGYSAEDKGGIADMEETVGGSFAYLAGNGFNIALTASRVTDDDPVNPDSDYRAIKLGYKTGKHSTAIMFGQGDDQSVSGDEAEYMGIGYVYDAAKWLDIYAGYTVHSLDRDGSDFDDIDILMTGARLKF